MAIFWVGVGCNMRGLSIVVLAYQRLGEGGPHMYSSARSILFLGSRISIDRREKDRRCVCWTG